MCVTDFTLSQHVVSQVCAKILGMLKSSLLPLEILPKFCTSSPATLGRERISLAVGEAQRSAIRLPAVMVR